MIIVLEFEGSKYDVFDDVVENMFREQIKEPGGLHHILKNVKHLTALKTDEECAKLKEVLKNVKCKM